MIHHCNNEHVFVITLIRSSLRMNTEMISDDESDDFTDEEEEEQLPMSTPTPIHPSNDTSKSQSIIDHNQWYIGKDEYEKRASTRRSSNILADGLLLTYDKNQQWIWRYYVLDNFDLICFSADKKSRLTTNEQSDKTSSPLWVSDITNAKVNQRKIFFRLMIFEILDSFNND